MVMSAEQKQLMALWMMLTTNNDLFQGAQAIPDGASRVEVAARTKKILDLLTPITGVDHIKPQMVAATMRENTFGAFAAIRDLYQSFAQPSNFWPPGATGDHPPLVDLQDTLFPAAPPAPVVAE